MAKRRIVDVHGPRARPGDVTSTLALRMVAVALARCLDSTTLETYASAEYLAPLVGMTARAVRPALIILRRDGWFTERLELHGRTHRHYRSVTIEAEREAAVGQRLRAGESAEAIAAALGVPIRMVLARKQLQDTLAAIQSGAAPGGVASNAVRPAPLRRV